MLSYVLEMEPSSCPDFSSHPLVVQREVGQRICFLYPLLLPIWYKAAHILFITNPPRHTVLVWKQRYFVCNIPRHTGTQRKKLQGAVTYWGDAIMTYRGLNFGDGHCMLTPLPQMCTYNDWKSAPIFFACFCGLNKRFCVQTGPVSVLVPSVVC